MSSASAPRRYGRNAGKAEGLGLTAAGTADKSLSAAAAARQRVSSSSVAADGEWHAAAPPKHHHYSHHREQQQQQQQQRSSPPTSHIPRKSLSDFRTTSIESSFNEDDDDRTERATIAVLDTLTVRTRSPTKGAAGSSHTYNKRPRDSQRGSIGGGGGGGSSSEATAYGRPASRRRDKESALGPWAPRARLMPHTTAALASRVSVPPTAAACPPQLQPPPLHQQSLEAQEAALLDDLLFVFMGLEGQYIRFADTYNPLTEKDRLAGPEFRIAAGLDPSLRDLTMTMLKMATHYAAVDTFVEVHSREEYGCVNHALCAGMRAYLARYLEMVAQLEHQLLTDASFTLHRLHLQTLPTARTFAQLYLLCHEILRRMHLLESDTHALDDLDDFENILESLRDGGGGGIGGTTVGAPGGTNGLSAKKICKGGGVLALLTHRLASMFGDPAARDLLTELLRAASRPYMAMLNEWLHHGGIRDPYAEFLIKEQRSIRKDRLEQDYTDEYWEKRYTIRDSDVPPQLEAVKEKVLLAGKYLNVVRECGGVDVTKEVQDVPETFDDPRFLDNVNDAYAHANSSLLNLLLTTHGLPSRLRSLKHYFFLDQSDFFSYFLELAASELKKPVKAVNVSKLQSLLDLVLRQPGSVAALDPYKEDVKVQMNEVGLTKWLMRVVSVSGIDQSSAAAGANGLHGEAYHQLSSAATASSSADDDKHNTGFSALELDYSVPFPLSLVVSRKTVLRYQLIFRYLLSLRHLETLLAGSWTEHCKAPSWRHRSSDARFEAWKRRAWTLRARMLVFVQQLLYFCTAEVIEPNWRALMARIEGSSNGGSAAAAGAVGASDDDGGVSGGRGGRGADGTAPLVTRTVDELMQDHVDFLDTCLKECMLTNSKLLRIHAKIMTTCTLFATYTAYLSKTIITADPDLCARPSPPSSSSAPSSKSSSVLPSAPTTATTSSSSSTSPILSRVPLASRKSDRDRGSGGASATMKPSDTKPSSTTATPTAVASTTTTTAAAAAVTTPASARPASSSSAPSAAAAPPPPLPAGATSLVYDPGRLGKLSDNLQKYEDNFNRHLKILLDALNYYAATETVVLLGLCARLSMASEGTPGGGGAAGGAMELDGFGAAAGGGGGSGGGGISGIGGGQ